VSWLESSSHVLLPNEKKLKKTSFKKKMLPPIYDQYPIQKRKKNTLKK